MSRSKLIFFLLAFCFCNNLKAQDPIREESTLQDSLFSYTYSTGWADAAVSIGYVTAPATLSLMFISSLVNEWNAGIAGIPASAMILIAPPLIYAGGRSADIAKELSHSRARLGWTLYALSIIPTSLALYGFTTDWGATLPLTLASGILGTASIVAMTSYAFSRAETARLMSNEAGSSFHFGIAPLSGGALATIVWNF